MRKPTIAILAVPLLAATAGAAQAEEVSVQVGYQDLNLATPQGTAALRARIDAAVHEVCGSPDHRVPAIARDWEACRTQARTHAYAQIAAARDKKGGGQIEVAVATRD